MVIGNEVNPREMFGIGLESQTDRGEFSNLLGAFEIWFGRLTNLKLKQS